MLGIFYHPKTAVAIAAKLTKVGIDFIIDAENDKFIFASNQSTISSKLGSTPRQFRFADGSSFVCASNEDNNCVINNWIPASSLSHFENSWLIIVVLTILAISVLGVVYYKGVPMFANWVVAKLPSNTQVIMGQEIMTVLDKSLFEPSKISTANQLKVQQYFTELVNKSTTTNKYTIPLTLHFRGGGILGANAVAIPNGNIIITDELLIIADFNKLAIQGVLAHEIGHIKHRHSLKQAVMLSVLPVFLTVVAGDLINTAQLIVSIPIIILEQGYSRDFEREADQYARNIMWAMNKSTVPIAKLFTKLAELDEDETVDQQDSNSILNTHPGIDERVEFFSQEVPKKDKEDI